MILKKLPKQKNVKLSKQEKTRIKNEEKEYKTKILNEINSCELKMLNSTFNFRQSLNLKNSIFDVNKKKTKLEEQTIKELDDNLIILDQIVKIYDQKIKEEDKIIIVEGEKENLEDNPVVRRKKEKEYLLKLQNQINREKSMHTRRSLAKKLKNNY